MSVLILTKHATHEFETLKLLESFVNKNITVKVCNFNLFDIVINDGIYYQGKKFEMPKIVLVRMGAGITRSELSVIRYFELAKVPCINTSESINIVQDKFQTSEILSRANIPVPTTMVVKFPITNNLVASTIGFPCVVKVVVGSFGEGVYLCQSELEYTRMIEFIDALHNEKTLIAQEYIGERPGEDLRVFVVGNKVLGAMKRTAPKNDFRANISNGGTGEKYEVTPAIEDIALRTANVLGLDIAGIDLLFTKDGFVVCEANSNPGFSGFNQFCNINVADHIVNFIEDLL